jgi:hypothetical protein
VEVGSYKGSIPEFVAGLGKTCQDNFYLNIMPQKSTQTL